MNRTNAVLVAVCALLLGTGAVVGYNRLNALRADLDVPNTRPDAPAVTGPVTIKWVGCDICKASFMDEAAEVFRRETGHEIKVEDGGASRGIKDVSLGNAHLGGTCRQCCLDQPDELGVKLLPIAWDCLVVVVHKDNPLEDISLDQLRDVYTGKLTRWEELTGDVYKSPILLVARAGKRSGVGFSVRQFLFNDVDKDYAAPNLRAVLSSRLLEAEVEREPFAIGVTGFNSARLRPGLKMLRLQGKEPTRDNVVSGEYLFYRPLYLSVPNRVHPVAQEFVTFLYSKRGQEIIRATNTVTLEEGKGLWENYKRQVQRLGAAGLAP
jgi:phosphate transport system substrate-binding protein